MTRISTPSYKSSTDQQLSFSNDHAVLPSFIIRQMTPEDIPAVYSIEKLVFPFAFSERRLERMRQGFPPGCFVAIKDSFLVGYILSTLRGNGVGHILSLAVHPSYQNQGIGTALLLKAIDALKAHKAPHIKLEVAVHKTKAISLYKKLGFRIRNLLRKYYEDGTDAYVMYLSFNLSPFD